MGSAYRRKQIVYDNMPEGQREVYTVQIGATGAVGTVRPSAGTLAVAGAGSLVTVSRLATGVYKFAFTQTYFKSVGSQVTLNVPFSTDGSTRANYTCQSTVRDATTNSICVFVTDNGAAGALVDPPSGSTLSLEKFWIESIAPATL